MDAAAYVADPAPPFDVPKADWNVRPGLALSLRDQFAYHYVTLKAATVVRPLLDWSAYKQRFSYRIAATGNEWFERTFQGWRNFDRVSIGKIFGGAAYVGVTDIAGYYENIDIGRLVGELAAVGVDPPTCTQLSKLWNKWAGIRARGIPQACAPSHVYGEFYLEPVDRALVAAGIDHARYLDDIRLFAASERQARLQLHELARLLRSRGLNLQTAKTEVLTGFAGKARFMSVHKHVSRAGKMIADELEALGRMTGYEDPDEVRRFIEADPENVPPEVVERAWETFTAGPDADFEKTVFHYLLGCLAQLRSDAAAEWAVDCLIRRPEETEHVLRYLSDLSTALSAQAVDHLADLLSNDLLIYDHQRYQILAWFYGQRRNHPRVLAYARTQIGPTAPPLLRPHAVAYLGDHGAGTDFGQLERALQAETDPLARATLLIALRREAGTLKNFWYGRCSGESSMVDLALQFARGRG